MDAAIELGRLLIERGWTIGCAESCTGGLLTSRLTDVAGSSDYVKGGVISYATAVKLDLLKVKPSTVEQFTVVSERVALEMADGVRRLLGTDVGLSTTGYAGPSGDEVGLVCVGFSTEDRRVAQRFRFNGSRIEIKSSTANAALEFAIDLLKQNS